MNRFLSTTALSFFIISFFFSEALAQAPATPLLSPPASITQVVGISEVSVKYSRPSVRGRVIFGGLVPYGEVWRTEQITIPPFPLPTKQPLAIPKSPPELTACSPFRVKRNGRLYFQKITLIGALFLTKWKMTLQDLRLNRKKFNLRNNLLSILKPLMKTRQDSQLPGRMLKLVLISPSTRTKMFG